MAGRWRGRPAAALLLPRLSEGRQSGCCQVDLGVTLAAHTPSLSRLQFQILVLLPLALPLSVLGAVLLLGLLPRGRDARPPPRHAGPLRYRTHFSVTSITSISNTPPI